MSWFLSFVVAPLMLVLPALKVFAPAVVPWLSWRTVLWAVVAALFWFIAGRLIAHGEEQALLKIERQNNAAVREGIHGAGRVRSCPVADSVWDPATGKCLRIGTSGSH